MITETMTIHEALCELKTIDNRIIKKIDSTVFSSVYKPKDKKINGKSVDNFVKDANEAYQSIIDLNKRRNAIKRALSDSNAKTKVSIAGTEYSVAEAIEMRRSGLDISRMLVNEMSNQYERSVHDMNSTNERVADKADTQVSTIYGTKEKVTTAEAMSMREALIESNKVDVVSMSGIEAHIKDLSDHIDKFMNEVDSKLSVSNALTTITIEY